MPKSENLFQDITLLLGLIGVIKALIEYRKAQSWKKAEFLAKEMKEFFADKNVQRALLILDWNVIDITLFEHEADNKTKFRFIDSMLERSLKHHEEAIFSEEEAIIRQIMDNFLFKLGMFQNYIDSKLISKKDIEPYLQYWIELIGKSKDGKKDEHIINQLWVFINYYGYNSVIKLVENFGYTIAIETRTPTSINAKPTNYGV